jgi:peptidoglycan hydrolase-like protein with peptidoglycan-binding domain
MQRIKKLTAIILSILTLSSVCVFGSSTSVGASGTGAGLAEWALNAYYSGWSYVYGGSTPGAVDCSGLIYSYCGGERCGDPQLNTATETGYVSNGIPRVHGLGLWRPGHVGVYVGDGMEVDARNESAGVCYQSVSSSYIGWTYWFKLAAVSYVTNGWEEFNGDYYYYENGQYIVDTSRTIDGTTYYFDSTGRSSQTPSDTSSSSSSSANSSESNSSSSSSCYKKGSSGEEVKNIQERLTELGFYNGSVDGSFGDQTVTAYKAFQEAAGVTVDGIAGSDLEILYSDDAPYAEKSSSEEDNKKDDEKAENDKETVDEEKSNNNDKKDNEDVSYKLDDENDTIAEIQSKLASLGYFTVEATGYFGEYTEQAVKNFQTANGLTATGIVDSETLELLNSEKAVFNPYFSVSTADTAMPTGPSKLLSSGNVSDYIMTNETNQSYANTAAEVAAKTNSVTNKALSSSSSIIPSATTAEVKRTASIWMWFVLVAVILAALAVTFFIRDRKATRYARYLERKKKTTTKAVQATARW